MGLLYPREKSLEIGNWRFQISEEKALSRGDGDNRKVCDGVRTRRHGEEVFLCSSARIENVRRRFVSGQSQGKC